MTIFRDKEKKEPKVEFSYPQSEALAEMIVKAWTDKKSGRSYWIEKTPKRSSRNEDSFCRTPS
jgi:hypothetical protein